MSATRSIHFPPSMEQAPAPQPKAYQKPDICLKKSMEGASDQIREELKSIGDEEEYATSLRVIATQAGMIVGIAKELLVRYGQAGGAE